MPVQLKECKFCGVRNMLSHHKYTDRCDICGKRYARYMSAKARGFNKGLQTVVLEYRELELLGFKVPRALKGGKVYENM